VIPNRIEELILVLALLAVWIYYFGLREESKIRVNNGMSIMNTVYTVLILSAFMTVVSFALLNIIPSILGCLLP